MKPLLDFIPIVLFFVVYKMHDDAKEGFLVATGVLIVATAIQMSVVWLRERRVGKMHLVMLACVAVFGGLTLITQDEGFIKWKPTIVSWIFAIAFLGSQFIGKSNIVKRTMGGAIEESGVRLADAVWTKLNIAWISFFTLCGALNLFVFWRYDTDTWVNFKVFGMLGLTFAFVLAQGLWLMRLKEDEAGAEAEDGSLR
ncbi:septation protein A [Thioalkalivibrio sp. HK1]|uniref:septation protein A n=1 Tax=Thioalkalivibrio sp. HK1 TaxID=1469245 RepID=UPI0004705658|nr:septation protein A [Thioalkalivibrio sp. HK1]